MPQANSTMSMPRLTSPCASVKTLPCSAVIIAASVSLCWLSRARKAVEHARAADRRHVAPGGLCGLGGGHRGVHVVHAGQQHLARGLAGGGVPHRLAARAVAALWLAAIQCGTSAVAVKAWGAAMADSPSG
jgi:hypothetical protein